MSKVTDKAKYSIVIWSSDLEIFKDIIKCSQGEKSGYKLWSDVYKILCVSNIYRWKEKISKIIRSYLLLVALWVKCFSSLCFLVLFQIFYNTYLLGKTVFWPSFSRQGWKRALDLDTSLPRHSVLSGCAGLSGLCESIFPCFRPNLYSFV